VVAPSNDTSLTAEEVKEKARDIGADLVGIIDCATLNENPPDPTAAQTPERLFPTAKSCIVIAKRMPLGEFLSDHQQVVAHTNAAICRRLERMAYRLTTSLENRGARSLQVIMDETDPHLKRGSYGYLSFRHLAVEAGLGTFGLEANLLTPEFGPRVYLNAVLTEADLEPDHRITEQLCIGPTCGRCVMSCPTDAVHQWTLDKRLCGLAAMVNGVSKILRGPVRRLLDDPGSADAVLASPDTRQKYNAVVNVAESFGVCPRCIEVCPVGSDYQKHLAREHRHIPETTEAKKARVAEMVDAEKHGQVVPDNPPFNVRWVGPEGFLRLRRGDDANIMRVKP
jgi:epoxyqueuosine reductase QueG